MSTFLGHDITRDLFLALVGAFAGAVIAFFFAAGWDIWKESRADDREFNRAARTIGIELATNQTIIANDLIILRADTEAAKTQTEVVTSPLRLMLSAQEVAFAKGSLESKSMDLAVELGEILISVRLANQKLDAREVYRMSNGAMSNFSVRRVMFNDDVKDGLSDVDKKIQAFLPKLEALRK